MTHLITVILMSLLLPGAGIQKKALPQPLATLVNTEREFASASLREGIRASFMKYFADDGVSMAPKPHLYRETASQTPPPPRPLARILYWEPILADVSSSGDLGYTMGPASMKDSANQNSVLWYGFYFSVWKLQDDGNWKVAVDVGTGSTDVVEKYFGQETLPAIHARFRLPGSVAGGKAASGELIALDRSFLQAVTKAGVRGAYQNLLDVHACAMRDSLVPINGREAILAYLAKGTALRSLEPMRAEVSQAGDMGYTYGAYRMDKNANDPSGYYVRVWRKDAKRKWVVVVEVANPAE